MTTVLHLSKLQLSLIVGVPCAVVALVALVGIYICWRTCRRTVTSDRRIVYNSYFSCTVFAIGFMIGPIVVLIVGFSIFHTAQVASFVMLIVGAALALIGITLTGHSTIELDATQQVVVHSKRYFCCYPRSRRARFDDVRGFTMCVNGIRNKVMYQLQLLRIDGSPVPLEPGFSNFNTFRRHRLCQDMNQFLLNHREDGRAFVPPPLYRSDSVQRRSSQQLLDPASGINAMRKPSVSSMAGSEGFPTPVLGPADPEASPGLPPLGTTALTTPKKVVDSLMTLQEYCVVCGSQRPMEGPCPRCSSPSVGPVTSYRYSRGSSMASNDQRL